MNKICNIKKAMTFGLSLFTVRQFFMLNLQQNHKNALDKIREIH